MAILAASENNQDAISVKENSKVLFRNQKKISQSDDLDIFQHPSPLLTCLNKSQLLFSTILSSLSELSKKLFQGNFKMRMGKG